MIFAVLAGCGGGTDPDPAAPITTVPSEKVLIYAVNYPLAYFAGRIGGDLVEVHFPAPAGQDPAYWTPDATTIAAYQGADLILLNGADYAKWVDLAALPPSAIVDTSAAFADRLIALEGATTHSHGPEGEHEHTGWAFTTWLDPTLAIEQARAVASAIIERRPNEEVGIQARFVELEAELSALDQRLDNAASIIGEDLLLFSHPVYQYLVERYGLNAVQLHWEPDAVPDPHAWEHLTETLAKHQAKWMLWEGDPLPATISALEELGVGSLLYDPCANAPSEGDLMSVMEANAGSLETIAETLVEPTAS
jgi:zinc transport system substrate-binding protein